jgi:hypothetical protein
MVRTILSMSLGCALAVLCGRLADADEIPIRKAGLWEMKIVRAGSKLPDMTMQHCTDETTDRDMRDSFGPMTKQVCSKQDIRKTATGYVSDSVCNIAGTSITSHSEIVGDFNAGYTATTTAQREGGAPGAPRDTTTVIEAKWLGACKADQKPGDIVMPGGFKLNVKDADRLKGLIPGK